MFAADHISYKETNAFSGIVTDYLEENIFLQQFYSFPANIEGISSAVEKKKKQQVDRKKLVQVLQTQYQNLETTEAVEANIQLLLSENTFTVCTAHQPNLCTGPLYFIYKILHAIKLAAYLKEKFPQNNFVPVFYMGSEDADLEELNHFTVHGKKYEWKTSQTGAVGRMIVDKNLLELLNELEGQLSVEEHGKDVIQILKNSFVDGELIQTSTFKLINALFADYGLVVLVPDSAALKALMQKIFEDDLLQHHPSKIVQRTSQKLSEKYDVQAYPRDINIFYLENDTRERIEKTENGFKVCNTDKKFTEEEMLSELKDHPEKFSPNVILRGLYQEKILPNVAFIGGGGEVAYWLQLKELFDFYAIPFPPLVLRNSFLIVEKQQQDLIKKIGLSIPEIFLTSLEVTNAIIEREGKKPQFNGELNQLAAVYEDLKRIATSVDASLQQHVEALQTKAVQQLNKLEKKMLRAERKKHEATQRQIGKLKQQLFPKNGLQERVENFSGYYAKYGKVFITALFDHSLALEQEFVVLNMLEKQA